MNGKRRQYIRQSFSPLLAIAETQHAIVIRNGDMRPTRPQFVIQVSKRRFEHLSS